MPEAVEPEIIHFPQSLVRRRFVERHAIAGDKNACAVFAEMAMHKHFFLGPIAENGEKLRDLRIRGRRPSADRDFHETHSERFRFHFLLVDSCRIFRAKIDDRGDAELLQFKQSWIARLRAAIQMIIDLAEIRNAAEMQFFAVNVA